METPMKLVVKLVLPVAVAYAALLGGGLSHSAEIVVGQVAPLSGPEASQGRAYAAGMQLLFSSVNKSGGVNGHTFQLVGKDDGGRPEDTVKLTRQLLAEDQPMVLAGYFGSRNITELLGTGALEKDKLALVGYRATDTRAETPLLYNVRANFSDELSKITEHLAAIGVTRLGLLYEEGPAAAALVATAEEAAKRTKATVISKASYEAGTTRVANAIDTFIKSKPQAIIMVSSGEASARFIERYRAEEGAAQIFVHSGADMERVTKRIAEDRLAFVSSVMRGVAIAQVVPSPYGGSRVAKELNDAVAKSEKLDVPLSYVMMEGYIAAKVIVEAVRRQGQRPTRQGMASALEGMENLNLGGYVVSFKPGIRTGSKFVELSIISDTGKIRQ
jgi:branched-chain amino acid transport system substrate-binding protein